MRTVRWWRFAPVGMVATLLLPACAPATSTAEPAAEMVESADEAALPGPVAASPADCLPAARAPSFRESMACRVDEFSALEQRMQVQLRELAARYPDGDHSAAAARQQLDACQTPDCLRRTYAQWQAYFDDNYDLGLVRDYL